MKKRIITLFSALIASSIALAQGVVTTNGRMQVDGNQIENKNGVPFSVAGNSMFWSGFQTVGGKFYTKEVVDHLAQNWKSGVIRAAMAVEEADGDGGIPPTNARFPGARVVNPSGRGYFNNPAGELAKVKTIIDAAIENDIYVIVDFHSHFAHFYKDQAIEFFTEIATTYGNNDHIIYEIFNEPIGLAENRANNIDGAAFGQFTETWTQIIKPYAIDVIKAIRAIDPDNIIIVGTPGFSQGVGAAADDPITKADLGFSASQTLNVAYTLHFYAGQPEHIALRSDAKSALDKGIALFVTEWGTVEASGDGAVDGEETQKWMEFMKENNISHANWSISDKFEGASVIQGNKSIDGLLNDELTISGEFVRCLVENWNTGFGTCEPAEVIETGPVDSALVPNGAGIKFEVEAPTQLDASTKSRIDFISPGLSVDTFDGEGILTGFKAGESVVVHANGFIRQTGTYTVQIVVSSASAGHLFVLQRDAGTTTLETKIIPNTGGLDKYQIVSIPGIEFGGNLQDLAIALGGTTGTGTVNIESFYLILDNDPALSNPEFDAELANQIKLYPNPVVGDVLTIESPKDFEYSILDLEGKTIVEKTSYDKEITMSSLGSGVYFVQLFIEGKSQVYKIVKE